MSPHHPPQTPGQAEGAPRAAPQDEPSREAAREPGAGALALRAAEQLIGAQKSLLNKGLRALTPLSAFEEVFDQRVAAALQRLGYPDPAEVARLREQVADLQHQVDRLKADRVSAASTPAPTPDSASTTASAPALKRRRRAAP